MSLRPTDIILHRASHKLVVAFDDGSTAPVDAIIYATGYRTSFPFLARELFGSEPERAGGALAAAAGGSLLLVDVAELPHAALAGVHRHATGVVPPVFEPLQALHQNRNAVVRGNRADDATHSSPRIRPGDRASDERPRCKSPARSGPTA